MPNQISNLTSGFIGAVIGAGLGIIAQYFFNKQADKKQFKLALINLKSKVEGKLFLIMNCGKEIATVHYTFLHRKWQDANTNAGLNPDNIIPFEKNQKVMREKIGALRSEMVIHLSELRMSVSEFVSIAMDARLNGLYIKVQEYNPPLEDLNISLNRDVYLTKAYSAAGISRVRNSVHKELEPMFRLLIEEMDNQIRKFDKSFFTLVKVVRSELYLILGNHHWYVVIRKFDNGSYDGIIYNITTEEEDFVEGFPVRTQRFYTKQKENAGTIKSIKKWLSENISNFEEEHFYFKEDLYD